VPSTIRGVGRNVLLTALRPGPKDAPLQCVVHNVREILEARDVFASGFVGQVKNL
jgi:hypothetical protein